MRADKIERVKRRLLREAVADNLDTIRGLPPRGLRRPQRWGRAWLQRAPLVLVPLTLAGSSYLNHPASSAGSTGIPSVHSEASMLSAHSPLLPLPPAEPMGAVSSSAFPLSVHRVVLDAGHGGGDPGASSNSRLIEKEVTFDLQSRLRKLLQSHGFEVVLTRTSDRLIPLRERARLANSSSGDIFVSIHVNSLQSHLSSHGVETYYLGPTTDPSLTRLAAAENLASGYSVGDLHALLDRVYGDVRRDESRRLAAAVQQHMFAGLGAVDPGLENWGVKRAPFIVLVATEMPAILAEVGCLSNDREAEMLGNATYRQQIAQALFHGIHAYASAHDAPQKKGT